MGPTVRCTTSRHTLDYGIIINVQITLSALKYQPFEMFEQVQARFKHNREHSKCNRHHKCLLARRVVCGLCNYKATYKGRATNHENKQYTYLITIANYEGLIVPRRAIVAKIRSILVMFATLVEPFLAPLPQVVVFL